MLPDIFLRFLFYGLTYLHIILFYVVSGGNNINNINNNSNCNSNANYNNNVSDATKTTTIRPPMNKTTTMTMMMMMMTITMTTNTIMTILLCWTAPYCMPLTNKSFFFSVRPSVRSPVRPSARLSVRPPARPPVRPSARPSVCLQSWCNANWILDHFKQPHTKGDHLVSAELVLRHIMRLQHCHWLQSDSLATCYLCTQAAGGVHNADTHSAASKVLIGGEVPLAFRWKLRCSTKTHRKVYNCIVYHYWHCAPLYSYRWHNTSLLLRRTGYAIWPQRRRRRLVCEQTPEVPPPARTAHSYS